MGAARWSRGVCASLEEPADCIGPLSSPLLPSPHRQVLFQPITAKRGKKGRDANGEYEAGEEFDVLIFNDPEDAEDDTWEDVVKFEGEWVNVDARAHFLFHLGEAMLMKALVEIEKALPPKRHSFVASKGTARAVSSKKNLSIAGREGVEKLKVMLPVLPLAQLKKMLVKAQVDVSTVDNSKEAFVEAVVAHILPGFPFHDPFAVQALPAEAEAEEPLPETDAALMEEAMDEADAACAE